jgi:hypothetical protein
VPRERPSRLALDGAKGGSAIGDAVAVRDSPARWAWSLYEAGLSVPLFYVLVFYLLQMRDRTVAPPSDDLHVRRRRGALEWVGSSHWRTDKLDPVGAPDGGELSRIHRAGQQLGELLEEPLQPRWRGYHQQPP